MKDNRQNRKTTRAGLGLFRIEGVSGIYGKVKIKGKTHTTALGTDNANDAREKRTEWVLRLLKAQKQVIGATGSLASYVEPYLDSRKKEVALGKLKPITIDNLRESFYELGLYWDGFQAIPLSAYTPNTITQMQQHLLTKARTLRTKKPFSPATYNHFVCSVSLLLDYLKGEGKLTLDQHLALKEKIAYANAPSRKVEIPTPEQLKIMRVYLYRVRQGRSKGECGVKFDFMMLTGARRSTVNACQVKHINFVRRTILLTHLKGRAGQPTEKEVPIVDELLEILDRYIKIRKLQPNDYLFTAKSISSALRSAAKAAGIERWYHHACRKWFATRSLIQTRDPAAVSDLLCHSNPKTLFEAYRQVCSEHVEGTVRRMKLFPGVAPDSSLAAATARAQEALSKFVRLDKERAAAILDHLLWLESVIDRGRFDVLSKLPGYRQDNHLIYSPVASPSSRAPSPALLKANLHQLAKAKGVYQSDVAKAIGIPRSTIARAFAFGVVQACLLPALSNYFGVTTDCLLTSNLGHPEHDRVSEEPKQRLDQEAKVATEETIPPMPTPDKSVLEVVLGQSSEAQAETVSRNMRSLLFERNLTSFDLAKASGIAYSTIYLYLRGRCLPRQKALTSIAQALGVAETEIHDPARDNIVPEPGITRANLNAILAHSGLSVSTYAPRLNIGTKVMKEMLATGAISPSQAHKIAAREGVSVRQLVSEDLLPRFPTPPPLDPAAIARNLRSICFEKGSSPAQLAKRAEIDPGTVLDYCHGKVRRLDREVMIKLATAVGLSLAEMTDPLRPKLEITPFFRTNLEYLVRCCGSAEATISRRCGLQHEVVRALLDGGEPTRVQIVRLAQYFELTPRRLLMEDLRPADSTSRLDSTGTDRNGSERPEAVQSGGILQPVHSPQITVPECEQSITHEGAQSEHGESD